MKRTSLPRTAMILVFFCGCAFGAAMFNAPTAAQLPAEAPPPPPPIQLAPGPVGRYQISTYATNSNYGCYLVDTTTGDLWYTTQGNRLRAVRK